MTTIDQIPKSWREISLEKYQELKELELEEDNFGNFEYIIEQLAILLDTDYEDELFEDMSIDQLLNIIKNIKWLRSNPSNSILKQIDNMYCIELNKLTFGEFLDLEYYFKDNYINNLHIIASIFYKNKKIDEWNNEIFEPYNYDIKLRSNKYLDMPITNTYGLINYYIEWKENILEIYQNVFENPGYDKIDNEEELDPQELAILKKEILEDKKKAEWSWDAILWDLSGNDITKYNAIFDLPFILVMNTLSMKKTFNI